MHKLTLSDIEATQKKYYNAIAYNYDLHYADKWALKYRYMIYDRFLKGINFNGLNVLDAMCGGGQNTGYFLSKGARVTGIDISENQCMYYKSKYPNNEIFCESILSSALKADSYDFIITDSVHHTHPEVKKCMKEFYRLLKPGGFLMLWEPSSYSIFNLGRRIWYKFDKKYFESNEKAIDLDKLALDNTGLFSCEKKMYGGNFAYIFVNLTMAMRIKTSIIKYYAPLLIFIEKFLITLQGKFISLWFLALLKKK